MSLGAFLVVFMGGLSVVVGGVIAQSGKPEAGGAIFVSGGLVAFFF